MGVVSDIYGGRRACVIVTFLALLCPLLYVLSAYSDTVGRLVRQARQFVLGYFHYLEPAHYLSFTYEFVLCFFLVFLLILRFPHSSPATASCGVPPDTPWNHGYSRRRVRSIYHLLRLPLSPYESMLLH